MRHAFLHDPGTANLDICGCLIELENGTPLLKSKKYRHLKDDLGPFDSALESLSRSFVIKSVVLAARSGTPE